MIRLYGVLSLVGLLLWIGCLIDAITTREDEVRDLPKIAWVLIVLLFSVVGSILWLVAGRPQQARGTLQAWEREQPAFPEYDRPGRAAASDPAADAAFLAQLRERAQQQRRDYLVEQERNRRLADGDHHDAPDGPHTPT